MKKKETQKQQMGKQNEKATAASERAYICFWLQKDGHSWAGKTRELPIPSVESNQQPFSFVKRVISL